MASSTASRVLNPLLYLRLERLFGSVEVSMPGVRFTPRATRNLLTGRLRLQNLQRGEHYAVCCPFCKDTKHRLTVSHAWGDLDDFGREMKFLMRCWNEDCLADPQNRAEFLRRMDAPRLMPFRTDVRRTRKVADRPPALPGVCVDIAARPPTCPCRAYLEGVRGFDVAELSKKYKVKACLSSELRPAVGRVIVPAYWDGRLVGWQGRWPDDIDWKKTGIPKYYTMPGMQTGVHLYNLDRASHWSVGVVCEGVTDVWRFGSMCVCTFGKSLNEEHVKKLAQAFRGRPVVLLYDPDTKEKGEKAKRDTPEWRSWQGLLKSVELLRAAFPRRLAVVWLPPGTDPGSMERTWLREYVRAEALRQGVRVAYTLWSAA